jgi:hypothetical protein
MRKGGESLASLQIRIRTSTYRYSPRESEQGSAISPRRRKGAQSTLNVNEELLVAP